MKKILIIDESDLYRDFLSAKMTSFGMEATIATNGLDGLIKLRQSTWDLVIMEFYISRTSCFEFLDRKSKDPNAKNVPVIIASSKVDRENIIKLSQMGIKKFFTKPIKIDALVAAISEILNVKLELDNTPCIIEANMNDDILFIEVSRGLNTDKIELLKYRLKELMDLYNPVTPKVLLMMSGLEISANDSLGLLGLLNVIMDFTRVKSKNFKILTNNDFVKTFVDKRENFRDVELVESLETAMDHLAHRTELISTGDASRAADMLSKSAQKKDAPASDLNMHFEQEVKQSTSDYFNIANLDESTRIAIVDDDSIIRQIIKKSFSATKANLSVFCDGEEFLQNIAPEQFDLVFLDLMMPKVDGFQVLKTLKDRSIDTPVIILSALSKKETVVKAMKFGVKSYVIKPVQPEEIQKKALEILRMNF